MANGRISGPQIKARKCSAAYRKLQAIPGTIHSISHVTMRNMLLLVVLAGALAQAAVPDEGGLEQANKLISEGKFPQAKQLLSDLDTLSASRSKLLGLAHFNLGEYPQAVEWLQDAVKTLGSEDDETTVLLARSLYLSGRTSEAIPWLEKVAAGVGNRTETLYMLGVCYIKGRRPDAARNALSQLYEVPEDSAAARLLTAQIMRRHELEEAAEKEALLALEADPKIPGAHFLVGEVALSRAELDRAIQELRQEIALNPNYAEAYQRLGDAYIRQDRWDEAMPLLQKAVWLNPFSSGPYILLGKGYLRRMELVNAEGVLRRAVQMDPQNYTAHYLLGRVLLRVGKSEEGSRILKLADDLRQLPRP